MSKRAVTPEDLLKIVFVSDPQISPNGDQILFTKKVVNDKNKYVSNLCSVPSAGGDVRQWTQGDGGAGHGRWSADGKQIAFISGRDKPSAQIFLLPVDGGEALKLTDLPEGSIGGFKWSPDGKRIAFTFRETDPARTSKAAKEREEKGSSTPPWELETLWYRLDGDGYFGHQRHKIYLVDVSSGKSKAIYDKCPIGSYSFDWLPDSSGLVVAHSANKDPLLDKPNDQLYLVPVSGKASHIKVDARGSKGSAVVSPDGKTVAYVGDVDDKDPWGVRNERVYTVSIQGGKPTCLTEKDDYCVSAMTLTDVNEGVGGAPVWTPDGASLVVAIGTHGTTQLALVDAKKGGVKVITEGRHVLGFGNLSKDGRRAAVTVGDPSRPLEAGVAELSNSGATFKRLTDLNADLVKSLDLSDPEETWLPSTDKVKVHAWVMKPRGFKSGKKYPAILEVHGGPHTQYGMGFFHEFQLLCAQGYVVVFSNPRGSKGYGEKFCAAIRGNWGDKDWADVQAVTKWMKSLPYVDSKQIGIMGGSYGGYMTNWAIGHSTEYKAAITDRCVANWVSMAGNSDFPMNKDGYFGGYAYGDLNAIKELWRQSPLAYFDKVKTPTLIIHSEGDLRCNVEQGEQVFYALKAQGIESRFVRYPASTSHGLSRNGPPDLRVHRLNEIVAWWSKHFK